MAASAENLIGRRYATDFRVVAITSGSDGDENREATLLLYGDHYKISLDELRILIESGLLVDMTTY